MTSRVYLLLAAAVAMGCNKGGGAALPTAAPVTEDASTSLAAEASVRWYGALRAIMHDGQTASTVALASVVPGPHAWGLGALEGLHGEVTVLDDEAWLARPKVDGTAEVVRAAFEDVDKSQGAALFVVANVSTWREVTIPESVSLSGLDSFLESQLRANGVALDEPVAIRIEGPVAALAWHVVDGSKLTPGGGHDQHARTAVSGTIERAEARLIGFFSKSHQGVFTHAGSFSHFHVLVESPLVSGHVDGVEVQPGARLYIAQQH